MQQGAPSFFVGYISSLFAHILIALITVLILENSAASAVRTAQVFSVTLEGGVALGGISQVPKEGAKKVLTPDEPEDEKVSSADVEPEEPKEEKKLTEPSVVDDPEKILALKKAAEEKEKREREKKKKEEEQKKKLKEEQDKKKEDEEKRKLEEKQKEKERKERDKKLQDALRRIKRYEGESAEAGGKGFGAASIGGKGMGGGTLASLEMIAYMNALKKHVKEGWHWLAANEDLRAEVRVNILPDGQIQDVRIEESSGNRNFDDSVVRAVYKASPVPPAPAELYQEFSDVRFTFDSKE